ncbi:hypothetical protein [Microbacterium sp.]|uniref:hypothetical protein n=1 Tax=Microbacterium sp. TaxID=51671 RepID=UPI0035ADF1D4
MDAASRAELDRLRVRAYGPDDDIWGDPAAVRRLVELEAEVVEARGDRGAEASARPAPEAAPGSRPPAVELPPAEPPAAESSAEQPPAPGESALPVLATPASQPAAEPIALAGIGGALILAIGGFVLARALLPPEPPVTARPQLAPAVLDARTAYSFAWDHDAVPLLYIPLDGSFGRYIDLPSATDVPDFPANGTVEWAYPLGKYFGWDVWIAGASVDGTGLGREHCIAVVNDDELRGRCVPAQLRAQSALLVSVPFAAMAADERPVGMSPDERLGFWWNRDRSVTVMIGDDR